MFSDIDKKGCFLINPIKKDSVGLVNSNSPNFCPA